MGQIIFSLTFIITLAVLFYSFSRYYRFMRKMKPYKVDHIGKRLWRTIEVALAQVKILKRPIGILHAILFWGFLILLFETTEMTLDGILGTERILSHLGKFYDILTISFDIYAPIIAVIVIIFILRRTIFHVKRFEGIEMKRKNHIDALIALTLILILMITLMGQDTFYYIYKVKAGEPLVGEFPLAPIWAKLFPNMTAEQAHFWYKVNWWIHIETIFLFANILPYSKHFHVYLSIPNVFLSRLEPMGKMDTMEEIKGEIQAMLNPDAAAEESGEELEVERFGALDVMDFSWKVYLDSLTCTQCGRCTSVCPANITGKLLSPRKLEMNFRERAAEIMPKVLKGEEPDQDHTLLFGYISEEELWACTTCHACVNECPVMNHHTSIILELRRYLVMEQSKAPAGLITAFQNIENNGAPWQFSQEDRMLWAENLTVNGEPIHVPTMAEKAEKGEQPEYLFWVGSAGAFDERYKKVIQSFVKILHHLNIDYAVLGTEEIDTGDVARRAGNEMLYQMQTFQIIEIFKSYNVKKIVTCDPHDYNTFKNEYPDFGGNFEVYHHTEFLQMLINEGILKLNGEILKNKRITYHDPCYLGRINRQIEAPRFVLKQLNVDLVEMPRHGYNSFCCGAGGGQMFKEAEPGKKEIFIERTEEALGVNPEIVVTACPFCMTMLTDGLKYKNANDKVQDLDIAELVAMDLGLA